MKVLRSLTVQISLRSEKKNTTNTYEFKPNDYNKLLKENMTTVCKKMDMNAIKSVDKETQTIAYTVNEKGGNKS